MIRRWLAERRADREKAVLDFLDHWATGLDICKAIGLRSGTVYPILERLEDRGLIDTRWDGPWPRRRYYRQAAAS